MHLQAEDEKQPPDTKQVPREIDRLPALNAVRENGFAAIHDPFETAANAIRRQVFGERVRLTVQASQEQSSIASPDALAPTPQPSGAE